MNVAASILIPTSFATRTIGSISAMTVRAAQFGAIGSLWSRISLARALHLLDDTGTRPRQADIGGDDTEVRHQVQQPLFDVERRIGDRRGLQAVAQGLVVQFNPGTGPIEAAVYTRAVPVVDKLALIHPFSIVRHNG